MGSGTNNPSVVNDLHYGSCRKELNRARWMNKKTEGNKVTSDTWEKLRSNNM